MWCLVTNYEAKNRRREISDRYLKNPPDGLIWRLIFAEEQIYVATSQPKRSQHDRRQAQRAEALRTGRASKKARSMEGRPESHWPAENEARCVMRSTRNGAVKRVTKVKIGAILFNNLTLQPLSCASTASSPLPV